MWAASLPTGIPSGMTRFRARVMYDGYRYCGMQYQPNAPTIQGEIEKVLKQRTQQPGVKVVGASRTDAGVHARGQAVHFDLEGDYAPDHLEHLFSRMLPDDVGVQHVELAPEVDAHGRNWHATQWATGKRYSYRFFSGATMDPLERFYREHSWRHPLDLEAMQQAASLFEGTHDFRNFANRAKPPVKVAGAEEAEARSTTRYVHQIRIIDEGGGYARAEFELKGALYKMVRNLMGALIDIGKGRRTTADVEQLLDCMPPPAGIQQNGKTAGRTGSWPKPASAHGLTLETVYYGAGWEGRFGHPLLRETVGADIVWQDE